MQMPQPSNISVALTGSVMVEIWPKKTTFSVRPGWLGWVAGYIGTKAKTQPGMVEVGAGTGLGKIHIWFLPYHAWKNLNTFEHKISYFDSRLSTLASPFILIVFTNPSLSLHDRDCVVFKWLKH